MRCLHKGLEIRIMTSKELKNLLYSNFASLKKPRTPWSREPISCRDTEYPTINHDHYVQCDRRVWDKIIGANIDYGNLFPDCDDFADIKVGLFKMEWWLLIKKGLIPEGSAPSYGNCSGYNPNGENHAFNVFRSDKGIYISDYGDIVSIFGYKPIYVRF
jgi:hypothetical protein